MIALRDSISIQEALEGRLPTPLNQIIQQRVTTFREHVESDLAELVHFIIVEPGDAVGTVEAELGMPLFTSPAFEWARDHGGWFEAVTILSDDGFGLVIFVPDVSSVDPHLLAPLRDQATLHRSIEE